MSPSRNVPKAERSNLLHTVSNIPAVYQAVEYVEGHLKEDVTVGDMAEAASYSLYHFCREFNRAVHHSPYDYLMRRRLSESARELVETERLIIDIALGYRFNNPETFSRAFRRMFDLQPNQWRWRGCLDERLLMPRLTLEHLEYRNRGDCLRPAIVEKGDLHLAGLMTLSGDDPNVVADLWALLAREMEALGSESRPKRYYGLSWVLEGGAGRDRVYMAAVEVGPGGVDAALVTKTLPASTCARLVHKGPSRDLALTLDYAYHTWLPKSGRRLAQPWLLEAFDADGPPRDDEGWQGEIYLPVD